MPMIVMDVLAEKAIKQGLGGPAVVALAIGAILVGLRIAYVCLTKRFGMYEARYSSSHNYITLYRGAR